MQAVGRAAGVEARVAYNRRNRKGIHARDAAKGKDGRAAGVGNDFLKQRFTPIGQSSVTRTCWDGERCEYEYITQENYEYLRDSYFRYAALLGRPASHDSGDSLGNGIANLYDEMDALIGDSLGLNIDMHGGALYFTVWKAHKWGDWTLYWLPVRFMEELNPGLRKICTTFYHDFMRSNGLSTIKGDYDAEMALEWMGEGYDQMSDGEKKEHTEILDSYYAGKAFKAIKRIESVPKRYYYKNLPAAIERYEPADDYEKELVALLKEGLQFIGRDKPSIIHYDYDPYSEQKPDWPPIDLQRQIRIVYDCTDLFNEYLLDFFNADQRETYCHVPVTTLAITPDTASLFEMDDYPERFFRWADRFVSHII